MYIISGDAAAAAAGNEAGAGSSPAADGTEGEGEPEEQVDNSTSADDKTSIPADPDALVKVSSGSNLLWHDMSIRPYARVFFFCS